MRRTVMPPDADLRGARARPPLDSARDGRRSTRDAGDDSTRDFFEQIGQFSTSRLWRQKVGIAPKSTNDASFEGGSTRGNSPRTTKGARAGALRYVTELKAVA
jgi:hypothetical protein